jgi:hypothetical protein
MFESPWFLLLEAVGATLVFTQGSIFKPVRERGPKLWREFSHCPLCVGVWVGMLLMWRYLHTLLGSAGSMPSVLDWGLALVGFGAASGTIALLVKRVWDYLESSAVLDDMQAETYKQDLEIKRALLASQESLAASQQRIARQIGSTLEAPVEFKRPVS